MTEASITVEDVQAQGKTVKLVKIMGQLDESNVDEKSKEIYSLIEQTPKGLNMIFELSGLEYMNSKSIGYLTDWYGKVNEGGGKIVIAGAKPNILDILKVVGITQLIQNFATLDEAKFAVLQEGGQAAPAAPAAPAPAVTAQPAALAPAKAAAPTAAPATPPEVPATPAPQPEAKPEAPTQPAAPTKPTPEAKPATPAQPAAPAPQPQQPEQPPQQNA